MTTADLSCRFTASEALDFLHRRVRFGLIEEGLRYFVPTQPQRDVGYDSFDRCRL